MTKEPLVTGSSMMLSRRYWIFDLDGTLTVPVHDFGFIRGILGIPDGSDILGFLGSLSSDEAAPLHERLKEIETELVGRTEAAPGAEMLVAGLHGRGIKMGILTRNTRENAVQTLAAIELGRFFTEDSIIGRDEAEPKPSPDGIHALSRLWQADPRDTVMVGDYLYDLQAGRAAGSATVHVDHARVFRWPDLADILVGSLAELVGWLPSADPGSAPTFRFPA